MLGNNIMQLCRALQLIQWFSEGSKKREMNCIQTFHGTLGKFLETNAYQLFSMEKERKGRKRKGRGREGRG